MERNYDDHGVQQRNGVNPRALKDRSNRIIAKKTETKPGLCILSGDVGLGDAVPGVKRNTLSQTSDGNRPKEAVADNSKGSKRQANSYTAHGKGYNDTILDKKPSERNYHVNTIRNNKRIFDKSEKYVSLKRHQGVQYMSKSDAVTTKGVLCRQKSVIARTESQSHKTLKSSVHSGNPVESKTVQNSSTGFSRSRKSVGDAKVTGMDISRTSSTVSSKSGGSSDSDKSSCRTLTRTNSKSVARDTTHRHVTPQKTTSLPKRISDKTSRQVSQETISLPKRIYGTTLRHVTSQETAASTRTVADVKPHFSRRVSASNKSDRYIKVTDRKESSTTGVDKVIGSKVTVTKKTKIDKLNPDSNHSNESNLYKHRTKVKNKDDKNAGWLYGADLKVSPWKRAKNLPDKTFESLSGGNVLESKSHINWKDIDSATVRRRRSLIPRACSSTQRASVTGDCDQNDTNYQGLVGDVATREEGVVLSVKGKSYTQRKEHVITGHMEICEPSKRSIDHRNDRSDDKVPQTEITAIGGGTVPLAGQTGMNYLRSKNKSGFTSSVNARYEGKRSAYNHVNNTDNQATFRKVLDSTADVPGESLNSVVPNSSEILTSSSDTQKLRHNLSKIPAPSCGKQRQTTTTSRLSENGGDQVEKFTQECNIVDVSVNTGNSPTVGDRNFTETYGADVHPYCNTDYENKPLDVNNGSEDDYQDVCNQQTSLTADGSNAISKGDAEKSQNIGRESRICRNKNREEQNTRTTKPATDTSYGSPVESSTNLNKLSVTDDLSKTTAAHVSVPADVPYLRRSISSLINDLPRSRDELRRFYEENVEERSPSLIPWRTFSFPDIYMDENSGMLETGDSGQEHTVEKGITKSATCENDLGKIKSSSSNNPQTTQKSQKTGNVRFQNVHKQKTQPNGLIPDNKDVPSKDSGICAEGKQLSPDSVLMDSGGGGLQVFNQEHVKDYGNCQEANTQGVQETGTRPKPTGNRSKLPRNKVSYLAYDNTDKGTGNSYTDKPTSPPPPYGEVRLPVNVHDGTGERFGVTTSYTRLSGSANEACTVTAGPNSAAHFRPSKNNGEALCGVLKGVLSGVRREDTGSRDTHHGVVQENIDTGNNTGSGIGIQWSERTRKTSGVREVRDTNINEDERHIWNINDSLEDIDNTECTGNGVDGNEKKYVVSPHFEKSKIAHKVNVKSRIAYKVNGKSQITHKVNDISESSLKQKAFSVVQTLDKGKYSDVLTSVQHTWNVIPSFSGRNIGVSTTDRTTCDGVIGSDHLVRPRGGTSSGFDNQLACETGVDGGHSSPNQDNPGEPCEGPDPESIKRTDVCYTTPGDLQTTEDVRCDKQQNATGVKMNKGTHSKSSSGTTKLPSGGNITKTPSTRPQSKSESNSSASKTLSKRTIPQAAAIAAKTSVVQAKSDSNSTSSKVTTLKRKGCKAVQTDRSGTRRHETGVKVKLRSSVEIDNRKISRDEHLIPVWRIDKTAHSDRTKVCKTFVDEQKCGTGVVENSRKKRTTTDISNTTSHSGNNLSAEVCSSDVINCQGDVTVNNTVTLSRDKEGYNPTKITARGAITIESPISDIGGTKEKTCTPAKKISSADSKSNLETSSTFTEITDPSDHVSRVGTRSIFHGHDIFPSQYCFSDRGNSPVTENPEVECSSAYDIRYVTWDDCALSDGSEVCTSQLLGINLSTPAINIVTDVSETVRNTDTSGSCKYIDNISVREYKSNNIEAHGDSGLQSVQYGISDQWASYQNEFLHTNVVESDVAADQIGIGRYGDILCPDGFSIPRPLPNDGVGNRNVGGDVEFISNTPAGTECDTYDTRRVSTIHVMSARDGVKVWSGEPDGKDEKDDDENECNLTCNALGTRYGITDEGTDNTSASDGANVWSGEPDGNDNAENECNLAVNALGTRYGVTDEGTDKEPDSNGNKVLSEQSESTGENVCHLTQTSYPDTDEETDMEVDESQCTLTRHASLRDGSNGITNHYDTANLHGVDIGAMTGYNTTSANTQGVNMAPEGPIQSPDIHQPITDCDNEGDNKSVVCLSVVTKTSTGSEGPCDGEKMDTNVQEGMLHDNPGGMVSNLKKAKNTELSANEEFKASGRKPVGLKSKEDKSTGSRNNRSVSKCKQGASNKVFSKSRSLSPQSCLRRDVKVTEDSYVSGTVYRDIPSKEKMTSIRIPRTSTPVSQPRLTASQKPRIPEAREPNRRVSKVVEHLTYEKNPQVSKTKSQSMDSVGRECFDSQQSISGKACNNRDKNSSALSKEKSISRDSSPSLSVSSNVKRPINSRESVSSVTGANKTSLIGKEKKDNINSVNRNTKSSDGTISKYNNTTRNAREPTYRPKSSEQRESSRVVGLQRLDRTDGTKRSQARNITKCNSRLSAGGVGNTHLKSGKREVTTATQFELEKLEKETIQTAMSVKTDTEPIKIPNEIGCEKNKKSQDNKEVRVSDMKPDLDNAMLSSSVTSVCGVSVPSSSIPNSCDPKRQCNTLSKPDITNTKTQRTSDTTGLSDKPSHMKTKSSSTSALPRHRAQSNTQTSSHMHCVKQNRRSAIPSPKPASLSHVSKNHSAQQTHGEVLGNKNKVQQQSGQELPQPRVSKRETSSRVKPVATIHRKTKESSPTDLYKRSRSSTPCDTSSEKSSTVVQRQNTEKMSTSVRNNLLLKPRQSSVPKPTRVKQKPNGNTDKSLEKCKPSNRPSVPKTLLNNSNTRKGINYAEIRPTKTKIEITMTSSPESDTSSPTLTCCDTNDRSEGSPSEGAVRSLESPSEVVTSLSSPYEGMASLPVTPMSPRFLSACSSIGSTPFTTPPEENKCFIVHERTSLKSSDSSTGEDEKIVLNERSLLESNDYLSPCTFDNINNGSEENDKSAGIDDCYPLTDIYNSRCEVSGEHTDITRRRLKTLRKVLKSDIADQSPLSETSHIKDPAAGCRTIVDIASCSENGEQLSNRETSEISTIVPFLTPKNVTELPVDGGGEGHSDGGTTSSDDYFSISEEDEGDNLTKDSVYDALSQHKIDLTGSLDQQASKRCADGCCGNIILKETGTSREYNSLVDICGSDKHQQTNIRKVIVPNLSPGSKGLSQYQNSGVTCANTTDRSIPETTDNGTSSTHYIHTSDLEKQDFECNMYENNTSFDSEFENITHPEKSYLDNVTVYINSQELGKNCVSDNSQNGSSDYEAELPVQANLGEYFDDGEDKLEMQINEHKEGAKDLRGIKRGGGSVETEGTFREIMDDISELSFKNILKHQNQPDGVCSVSNIKPQARLESELLTLDSSVLDVCEEGKSGTKTSEPSDGFGEQHHTDQHEQHVHHHVIEKYTDCQQTEQHGQHVHQHVSGKYTDCQQTEQHGQHVHQHVSGKYTDCQQTEQHGQHVHQHVSGKYTDCQQTEQHGQHVHQHVSGKYTDCQQTEQHGQHVHQHVSGKYTDCQQTEQHEQHTDENLIGNYTNKYGTHYCVSELNVQSKDERDLTDDHHNESPDRVDGGNGVTENEIIGEHFDSDSDIDSEQKYDSDETSGDTDEMNEKRGQCHESNMATIATSTAAATDSVHTPGRALSSRNETCIRKYEIVTTTITRHKKRETKIIESSSNVSTNTARLHEKPVTDHGRNLVNSRRVKFETSKQIISASDVDGNVFSTVKSSTNTATLGHGNSSDTISQASSEKRAALMHGETITMPECLESESIGKVKRCSVDTDTDSGDLQQAISNEEILNYGECDTTVAIPRDNEYRKYKTLEQGPTLSPRLTRYKISNFEDVQNCPPPSPILTRGNFISDRDNPTLSPRLTRGNFISERESPTLSPRLTRGDTKTSVIKSRSSTTQTYNVLRRAVPGDSSISDLSQVIKLGQAGVKACVRRETQTIQSTYQTRPISPNTDTLTSGDTASELSDTGTNTDLKSGGFSQVDSTSVNGDERFMNDNPGTVVALSMISNTPEKIDGTGNIYESYTDSVGDNCSTSTLAITTITETPQVAILVTKELSDSDNDCLSEVDDAEHLKTKRSCDDNELCTDSTNKTSINENDTQSGTEVNVSDDVSSASDDQVIPGVPDIDVTFTITLPGSVCGSEGSTSGRDQSPEIMNIEFNNEVADTTQNASDKGAGAQISNEITVSVNNALHEPSVLSISASNDSETKTILKGTTEDNSEKLTKAQRRENARQPMRRYTATVCLFEREEGAESDDLDMSPPTRPRARSKSPVELKNTASVPESKQQVSVYGNGRVSEMCRNIFQKGSKGTPATSSEEPPASPLTQSPSLSRKKWVRDNGSWKRVTLAEYDRIMAAKESPILEVTSSTEDVSQGQESADDIAPYEEQKCQPGAWLSKNKETTSVIQEELDLHESIPYMDNDAGQAFNDKVFNLDITSEELSSKVVEQSVSIPNEISKSPRNEQNLMDELDAADAKFSVRDIIVKNEEHMIRRDSLKDISKDGVKTPPKTLPKPKHRRKSDITQDKGNQPSDGTGAEVTVDGQTTSDVDPSKDVVDLDRTLTDNAYVHLEGPETVREGLAVRNELVSLVSDNTSGVHTLVKSRDDINDQNAVLAIDNDRENLSELEYKHNGGSSEALSTDSRNVSTHSRISITSDEVCKGMRSTIHGEPGCVENSEVKIDNMVDLNKTSSANASVKVNTDDIAMATEKEISKEDSSPELERMSFAQKLKKAQRRSESKLETMDITRSRRVTDRKVTGTNDHKSTDSKLEICDDRNVNAVRQNYPITVKGENPEMSAPVDDKYIISSPQKLRAIRIKQEIFPKEEPEELKPQAIKKLKAVKISSETFPREEIPTCEKGGKFESRDTTAWLEDAGGRTPTNSPQKDSGFTSYLEDDKQTADSDTSVSQVDYPDFAFNMKTKMGRQLPRRCINPVKFSYGGFNGENSGDLQCKTEADDRTHETPTQTLQRELLSEIVELEENSSDQNATNVKNYRNENERKPSQKSTSPVECHHSNQSPCPSRSYNRSQSLPTGTLSYGGSRIVYKDGHFVIENGLHGTDGVAVVNGRCNNGLSGVGRMCDTQQSVREFMDQDYRVNSNSPHMKHLKRISYSEPQLCEEEDSEDDSEDVSNDVSNVFIENDGNVTVIANESEDNDDHDENATASHQQQDVKKRTKPDRGSKIPRPLSVDENQLISMQDTDPNSTMKKIKKSLRDARARRSKSFREVSDQIDGNFKLKRNSSFKEAQEKGALEIRSRTGSSEYDGESLSRSGSVSSVDSRPKSPGFLQKLLFKRKSFTEKNLKGEQSTKESFMKKMSLKGLFTGKKDKSDLNSTKCNSDEPPTPPIAAFQGDLDIHAVSESAPNSPFSNLKFRRRHTSADLFVENPSSSADTFNTRRTSECNNSSRQPPLPSSRTTDESGNVKFMLGIDFHPKRPISPKPPLMSITRRNSNLSLPSSPLKESPFELTMDNSPNKMDTDSISTCSSLTSSNVDSASVISGVSTVCDTDGPKLEMKSSGTSGQDLETLTALGQGEMTSSNSNDSGIQHDVSVHSSSESLKTTVQDSTSAVVRRRKSPSPRPERPKSEISVRWADLVETTEISPIKRREASQRNKPRPKSDLEDNLELFDELYGEVLDDLESSWEGGSSLKSEMKPFGSQTSILPYNSLQSLDSFRQRQEAMDQKPSKRRMSTPQPIKLRLERSPRKQKIRKSTSTLVRSHSMPESLDKLHRRRKKQTILGCSNLHGNEFHHLDDDSSSDDGSDYSMDRISLHEKSLSVRSSQAQLSTLDEMPESEGLTCAEALWDHITMDPEELGFHAGDVIEVMDMGDKDWWWGAIDDREGWFPATFVRLRVNQEQYEEDLVSQSSEVTQLSPKLRRVSVINKEQARENVVNEIISAEREYVKHLRDVVEGYIKHARKRSDMFSEDRISVVFGNIEDIYSFSNRFLGSLDDAFNADSPHLSELGHCFLTQSKEFEIYSDYCNNHPSASEELKDLYRKQKYQHFFEACRLLQEMMEIPLEGFLLTPVQKICKYPLQLAELLKYTPPSHPDYHHVQGALDTMKKIAALINERKRKMESIEKLARWQQNVEDWQGPDILEESSELIASGEFNKINSGGWSQERYFFLFDHQLVYCKKDLLKRNGFSYKGRVDLDECEVIALEDGKDVQYNVSVKHAWKLHETIRDKWYLLYTKTAVEKQRWLRAFQKERHRVKEDQENNFVPLHWKKTVLNKLRASKEKLQTRNAVPIQYQKEFLRGIPSHATLPRSYTKKQRDKKKGWSLFGNKKSTK